MASIEFCNRGGQEGIAFDRDEQAVLAEVLAADFLDEYVPLPKFYSMEQQADAASKCEAHDEVVEYYERYDGAHGWCCSRCGKVVQWG